MSDEKMKAKAKNDIFSLDDLKFYQLEHKGFYGDTQIFINENYGINKKSYGFLLKPFEFQNKEIMYAVDFVYRRK